MKYVIRKTGERTAEVFRVTDHGLICISTIGSTVEECVALATRDATEYGDIAEISIDGGLSTGWRETVAQFKKCADRSCSVGNQ